MRWVKTVLIFIMVFAVPILAIAERRPVKIEIELHEDVYKLHSMGVSIENLRENYVETALYPEEIRRLIDAGYKITDLPLVKTIEIGYHDYFETEAYLDSMHLLYPGITRKITIGHSVQGRIISAFLITDYPDSQEAEPEINFGGGIHGNEPVSIEMPLYLISYLLDNYGIDAWITYLIDNTEIWFVPLLNPDGRQIGARRNANNIDLNRNFPVPDGSIGEDWTYAWEPETQALIDFYSQQNFIISTMFHGGALVVNYVWDYSPNPAPDSGVIQLISLGYSYRHGRMWTDGLGYHGTIHGWHWYPVFGSVQDWAYDSLSIIDLTIEVDNDKWPHPDSLPKFWDENRDAMIYLIEQTHTGISGVVTDSLTGEPVLAEVRALEYGKEVFTDPDVGDYYKLLRDGFYTMQFSAPGYATKTYNDVYVRFDSLTILNVCLSPYVGIKEDENYELRIMNYELTAYPNPFRGYVRIAYSVMRNASEKHSTPYALRPTLGIYDLTGRLIRTLPITDHRSPIIELTWDGRDKNGDTVPSGLYFVRLNIADTSLTARLVKIR